MIPKEILEILKDLPVEKGEKVKLYINELQNKAIDAQDNYRLCVDSYNNHPLVDVIDEIVNERYRYKRLEYDTKEKILDRLERALRYETDLYEY